MSLIDRSFQRQVRYVTPDVRDPRNIAVRAQILRDFGALVPPFALHLPSPDALRAYWAIMREPTNGPRVSRAAKEAVAATVSAINSCPYCVDVHTTMLRATGERVSSEAVAAGQIGQITDSRLRALAGWARATRRPGAPILRDPPFPPEHAPELIGVALSYHYINRMINIFAGSSPFPLPRLKTRSLFARAALPVFRRLLAKDIRPGASLDLLAPAPLPADLAWARPDPIIADAFARASAAFDTIGEQSLPLPVRDLVIAHIAAWNGDDPGLSRRWADTATEQLPPDQRPLARLALLTALASHQVDEQVINDVRALSEPAADATLIAATAWAAFTTARRIGTWLRPLDDTEA
jgi:AhpD family alkylhydroperoxidase